MLPTRFQRLCVWLTHKLGDRSWVHGRFIKLTDKQRSWRYQIWPKLDWEKVVRIHVFWWGLLITLERIEGFFPGCRYGLTLNFKNPVRNPNFALPRVRGYNFDYANPRRNK